MVLKSFSYCCDSRDLNFSPRSRVLIFLIHLAEKLFANFMNFKFSSIPRIAKFMKLLTLKRSPRAANFHWHIYRGIPRNKNAPILRGRETESPKFPPNAFRKPDRAPTAAPQFAVAPRNPLAQLPPRFQFPRQRPPGFLRPHFASRAPATAPPVLQSRKRSAPKKQIVKFAPKNSYRSISTLCSAIPQSRCAQNCHRHRGMRGEASVCKAKRARQTKRCTFNRLRDVSGHGRIATAVPERRR
jgi:hypothetical protein